MNENTQTIVDRIRKRIHHCFEIIAVGEQFQIQEIYDYSEWENRTDELKRHDWEFRIGEVVFAADSNGNFFTICSDGSVSFLDHETDERTYLCESLAQFEEHLEEPQDVALPPQKVISVWVDPDFKPEFD